jgi:hypothetical protein
VVPWEVRTPLCVAELAGTHTFSGNRSLYVATFIFAMNKAKYEDLPADLKTVIDANSGMMASRWAGKVMDEGDVPGLPAAKARQRHRHPGRRRDQALARCGAAGSPR